MLRFLEKKQGRKRDKSAFVRFITSKECKIKTAENGVCFYL